MKIKNLSVTLGFICAFCLIGSAFAEFTIGAEQNGNITNYYAVQDPVKYAGDIIQQSDSEKKKIYEYAKSNPDKVIPITYMALADYIYKTNKSDALFWFYVGSMRAYQDLSMCTDQSVWAQISIYPMLAPNTAEYSGKVNEQTRKNLTLKALKWDEEHPNRVNPQWACYNGTGGFSTGNVTTKPMSEYTEHQKQFRENVLNSLK